MINNYIIKVFTFKFIGIFLKCLKTDLVDLKVDANPVDNKSHGAAYRLMQISLMAEYF
ncbi:MAG: hypothetical protein CM15mP117_17420 [Alphaproteobacteria bacterium]|nr:MAG: hypothetical protein CM15mP117_17420 [Alphaproteobacteria bacterium]